jgi:cell division septation protein DedD
MAAGTDGERTGGGVTRALLVALAVGAAVIVPGGAAAQAAQVPTLDQVDALVASGRTESARAALMEWWEASLGERGAAARSALQHALWLRGVLTVDPAQALLDYRRLVVEYPGGAYSDQASLRLAMISEARGDAARAREQLRAMLRDYPSSPYRADAERLLAVVTAPGASARTAAPSAPRETQAVVGASGAPPVAVEPAPEPAAPAPSGRWTVQVGAFANPERARSLRDDLVASGIDARLVVLPGSPLLRVRAGRFPDEDQANALRRGLAARGFDASVSPDADREEAAP